MRVSSFTQQKESRSNGAQWHVTAPSQRAAKPMHTKQRQPAAPPAKIGQLHTPLPRGHAPRREAAARPSVEMWRLAQYVRCTAGMTPRRHESRLLTPGWPDACPLHLLANALP